MNEITDDLAELNTRMALVEKDLALIAGMRKWVMAGVVGILAQAGGMLYTYGQLTEKVNAIGSETLVQDVSSNRRVLSDHSSEIENVRTEQARVRERIDISADRLAFHVDKKGHEILNSRVLRLEDKVYNK